ncbi:MAG: hypothetical protein K2I26_07760 [Paramuribaculum sp.]|nr:hypothetical protein [Paramuribaculum sp.]
MASNYLCLATALTNIGEPALIDIRDFPHDTSKPPTHRKNVPTPLNATKKPPTSYLTEDSPYLQTQQPHNPSKVIQNKIAIHYISTYYNFHTIEKFSKIIIFYKYFIENSWQKQRISTIFAAQKTDYINPQL